MNVDDHMSLQEYTDVLDEVNMERTCNVGFTIDCGCGRIHDTLHTCNYHHSIFDFIVNPSYD